MIRALFILVLLLSATGCASYSYTHTSFAADGTTLIARYQVSVWRNAMDTSATSAHLTLADGTTLDLEGANESVDKNVTGAVSSIFASILGIGALALKFLGL